MNSWIVTFKDGNTLVVHNKDLVVNVSDYIITNTNYDIEDVIAINLVYEA